MELANCFSIPILPPFVHFSISQLRLGMMERCREMMGLLQPAWLSTAVLRPQSSGGWCSEVYNNYLSIWVSGGTATWQGTEIFLFQQGPEVYDCDQWHFFCCWTGIRDGANTAGLWSGMLKEVLCRTTAHSSVKLRCLVQCRLADVNKRPKPRMSQASTALVNTLWHLRPFCGTRGWNVNQVHHLVTVLKYNPAVFVFNLPFSAALCFHSSSFWMRMYVCIHSFVKKNNTTE